jgi:hypothetical protein
MVVQKIAPYDCWGRNPNLQSWRHCEKREVRARRGNPFAQDIIDYKQKQGSGQLADFGKCTVREKRAQHALASRITLLRAAKIQDSP